MWRYVNNHCAKRWTEKSVKFETNVTWLLQNQSRFDMFLHVQVIQVVEFSNGDTKLERFLPKNQHTQKNFLNFENRTNLSLSSLQKSEFLKLIISFFHYFWCQNLTFKVNFLFNNFLWVCWFLCKNLTNFVPPVWKLHIAIMVAFSFFPLATPPFVVDWSKPWRYNGFKFFPKEHFTFYKFLWLCFCSSWIPLHC